MKKKKRKKLSVKMMLSLIVFVLLMFVFISLIFGFDYYVSQLSVYQRRAFSYARAASQFIDGDRVLGYLQGDGVDEDGDTIYYTDAYYDEVMAYLESSQEQNELLKYYYVFVPNENSVTYIWDADTSDTPSSLGDNEKYMDGAKEAVDRVFNDHPVEKLELVRDPKWGFIATAFYPIYNSAGEPVAVVGADYSMDSIDDAIIRFILTVVISIFMVTAPVIIIYYHQIKRTLIEPIKQLNTATKGLVENLVSREEVDLEIHTGDEIEELAGSFDKMHADLSDYIDRLSAVTAEKERIGAELNIAAKIQADMLPRDFPAFPEHKEFELFASMDPAKEVGGDFYDYFLIDDDHICLVIADVSGKGVPAALFMANAKTMIKNRAQIGGSPGEILEYMNEKLCESNKLQYFVTVWLAIVELSTGRGLAANAGHEHPALRRKDGTFELVQYRHSPGVAMFEKVRFLEHPFELYPGDALFVYTDGVTEATDSENELFGADRMLRALNLDPAAAPEALLQTMRREIDSFVGDVPQFDDITMLAFRYDGVQSKNDGSELTISADRNCLDQAIDFVDGHLQPFDSPTKIKNSIRIAVEELFVNIASYAYPPGTGSVTIRVETALQPPSITITFIDRGIPFDPLKKHDPDITIPPEERQIGGLGILMVKKIMDQTEYTYRDGQNIMTIKKNL